MKITDKQLKKAAKLFGNNENSNRYEQTDKEKRSKQRDKLELGKDKSIF